MTTRAAATAARVPRAVETALAASLILLAAPGAAQEVTLPSGLAATLFDVVLEASSGPTAPDAFTDPESEDGEAALADLGHEPPAAADPLGPPLPGPPSGGLARFRLVVPGLGEEGADYDRVAADFAWVCAEVALPALAANGWAPTEVVVTLSDRETAFGVPDPDATQFFEGFRIERDACVPQAF